MIALCLALYILVAALTALFIIVLQDRAPWTVGTGVIAVACIVFWPASAAVGLFVRIVMWIMEVMA